MAAFSGKAIVVTGASDGIGAELARQLAAPARAVGQAHRAGLVDRMALRALKR